MTKLNVSSPDWSELFDCVGMDLSYCNRYRPSFCEINIYKLFMLSDFRLKYILIGRNNKIGTTVLPSSYRSVIIFSLLGKTVVENCRQR